MSITWGRPLSFTTHGELGHDLEIRIVRPCERADGARFRVVKNSWSRWDEEGESVEAFPSNPTGDNLAPGEPVVRIESPNFELGISRKDVERALRAVTRQQIEEACRAAAAKAAKPGERSKPGIPDA